MKTIFFRSPLVFVIGFVFGLLAANALSAEKGEKPAVPAPPAAEASSAKTTAKENEKKSPAAAIEDEKAAATAARRHILPPPDPFLIAVPPPSARAETKTPAPAANLVWRPGHWAPVKGEWQWVAGDWAPPPLPSSVWIEGEYDPKAQRWNPGYWQPDRLPVAAEEKPAPKESLPPQKF